MSQWLDQVIEQAANLPAEGWLAQQRHMSLAKLKNRRWPSRKTEAWRYTSLSPIEKRQPLTETSDTATVAVPNINGLDCIDLVFSQGQLVSELSSVCLPEGVRVFSLNSADARELADGRFTAIKPERHLFGLINDSLIEAGVVIHIAEGVKVKQPIRIVNVTSGHADNHSRLLVSVAQRASAVIIEHGEGVDDSMNTAFSEFDIAAEASLEHYRFALFTDSALHAGGSHFRLADSSYLNSTILGFGSKLSRLDVDVEYTGENANADINAMYLLAEGENFDFQSCIEHAVPHCTTDEKVRGIVGDKAKANFNGRIHIHRHAQKTLAELNNRNLLLSRGGQINTKPELEIYADDVKCAHGATIAEIEERALYYLLSRGISRSQALIMLNFGFIQELINEINNEAIREWMTELLRTRFARMEVK
ncbi:Fe-S cluster assembly protein SufD [Alteromonas sediminis]|uniref:Fe-S cluster assembly protein SufD n=1 Tax=Alteromonas sediminis TaxID=2259342 RepID=A0A3N5Y5V3_9ALTE|nr:Fe-S cluster assembly protein SufD [Alteromonas sediminis]RPJ65669.1 Fe-S cluster assembly protein SufD [Alteromonas sediminis]